MSAAIPPRPEVSTQVKMTAQNLTLTELESSASSADSNILEPKSGKMVNPIHQVKATLSVCVGTAEVTVGDLLNAREHQVLQLEQTVDQPVDVTLGGQIVARGILVAVGDHFGVRITELPLPLKP